ncbi:MAG: Modification methylase DpnIIB [Candidatus Heimdallarchaeota archaeon LC_2]|nr:MAG: Modification methylase DpnIIB [Candidatus Heimdallarchaeota archaeon LC_2]
MEVNRILQGNCVEILNDLPENSVDMIFADPPYNLQIENNLLRPNEKKYDGVADEWDKFATITEYDKFTLEWLKSCKKVLKDDGTIWVIGTYHNIYRIGTILHDLGFWILNDIIWVKTNPTPNFRGTRFTNAHETIIWAKKSKKGKYTFNYNTMKKINGNKQMRSDWLIPICQGKERVMVEGKKAHSTQKPEALLSRVILSSTNIGDLVLDPFFGSGTTGAVAKKLKRNWIGIEKNQKYIEVARNRIDKINSPTKIEDKYFKTFSKRDLPRIDFVKLIEMGMLGVGETLYSPNKKFEAIIKVDGTLSFRDFVGSIHKLSAFLLNKSRHNGWDFWYVIKNKEFISIETLRIKYRKEYLQIEIETDLDLNDRNVSKEIKENAIDKYFTLSDK